MIKTMIDQIGREVEVPRSPQRIISLVPSITETLFYLGLDEEVVGITKFCIHPRDKFKEKPKVGGTKKLHLDWIREQNPDLIIANKEENRKEDIRELEQEFPVWVSYVITLEDAYNMIEDLGKLVDRKEGGQQLVDKIQQRFSYVTAMERALRVAYFIWRDPYMVVGGDTFINSLLKKVGFINVFEDAGRYPSITVEDIEQEDPDVLFFSSEPFPFKEKYVREFENKYDRALTQQVDGGMFSWYGSRLLQTPEYLNQLIKTLNFQVSSS